MLEHNGVAADRQKAHRGRGQFLSIKQRSLGDPSPLGPGSDLDTLNTFKTQATLLRAQVNNRKGQVIGCGKSAHADYLAKHADELADLDLEEKDRTAIAEACKGVRHMDKAALDILIEGLQKAGITIARTAMKDAKEGFKE